MRRALCINHKTKTAFQVKAAFSPFARVSDISHHAHQSGNACRYELRGARINIELLSIPETNYAQVCFEVKP